jgi:hypothetical protein
MGDRSNIAIQDMNGNRVYLYAHWLGEDILTVAKDVLERRERWDDEPYLARMMFNAMTKGDEDASTGFGITTYLSDYDYPVLVVNPSEQTVWLETVDSTTRAMQQGTEKVSFETFINCVPSQPTFLNVAINMGMVFV